MVARITSLASRPVDTYDSALYDEAVYDDTGEPNFSAANRAVPTITGPSRAVSTITGGS